MKNGKFLSDSIWSLLSSLSSALSTFSLSIIYVNKLGVENFGIFGLTQSTILLLAVVGCFGLNITILRYVAENIDRNVNIFNHLFIAALLGIFLVLGFLFFSYLGLVPFVEKDKNLLYVGLFIPFYIFCLIFEGVLSGYKKFSILAKINFFANSIYFFSALILLEKFGLLGVVYGYCGLYFLKLIFLCILVYKNNYIRFEKLNLVNIGNLAKESLPVSLQEIMQNISGWVVILLILSQSDYKEVGLFNVILQIMMIFLFIPGVMKNVVLSYLSSGNDSIKIGMYINIFSVLLVGIFLFIFSDYVFSLYGKEVHFIASYIPLIVIICLIISVCNIYVQKMISMRDNWRVFYSRLGRDIILYLIFILIVIFDFCNNVILAVLLAYIISNFIYLLLTRYQVKKYR